MLRSKTRSKQTRLSHFRSRQSSEAADRVGRKSYPMKAIQWLLRFYKDRIYNQLQGHREGGREYNDLGVHGR